MRECGHAARYCAHDPLHVAPFPPRYQVELCIVSVVARECSCSVTLFVTGRIQLLWCKILKTILSDSVRRTFSLLEQKRYSVARFKSRPLPAALVPCARPVRQFGVSDGSPPLRETNLRN
jgi:hypothetical protein